METKLGFEHLDVESGAYMDIAWHPNRDAFEGVGRTFFFTPIPDYRIRQGLAFHRNTTA